MLPAEEGRSQSLPEPRTVKPPCQPPGATTEHPRLLPTGLTQLSAGPHRRVGVKSLSRHFTAPTKGPENSQEVVLTSPAAKKGLKYGERGSFGFRAAVAAVLVLFACPGKLRFLL